MPSKYIYEYVVQGNYGYGFNDLVSEGTRTEAKIQLRCYRVNEPGIAHRIVVRRTLREQGQG